MGIFTIFSKKLSILIALLLLITNYCLSQPNIPVPSKNIILHEKPKDFPKITLEDKKTASDIDVTFNKQITVINFWATWCAPCREEMPSLDNLQVNLELNNLKIFPINIGREDISKSESFFKELNIKNLDIYFDSPITLAKKFSLRGVPTTIFFNKKGEEFARLIGSIDFNDEGFIKWLKNYN